MKHTTPKTVVYILQAEGTPHYKIGVSANLKDRVKSIQTGCPYNVVVREIYDGDERLERRLHERFSPYRGNGEWFSLPLAWRDMIANGNYTQSLELDVRSFESAVIIDRQIEAQPLKQKSPLQKADSIAFNAMTSVCCMGFLLVGWMEFCRMTGFPFHGLNLIASMPIVAILLSLMHRPLLRFVERSSTAQ